MQRAQECFARKHIIKDGDMAKIMKQASGETRSAEASPPTGLEVTKIWFCLESSIDAEDSKANGQGSSLASARIMNMAFDGPCFKLPRLVRRVEALIREATKTCRVSDIKQYT